jgi:hypothetical protein
MVKVKETKGMKTIWYFVGLILLIMGALIEIAGFIDFINPPEHQPVLAHLHTSIWWGLIMIFSGLIFLYVSKGTTVE